MAAARFQKAPTATEKTVHQHSSRRTYSTVLDQGLGRMMKPGSPLLPRFLAEAMKLRFVREHIESRLTGTSPTMKNVSKPALLDIRFSLPDLIEQQRLVDDIGTSRTNAAAKRTEAATLRQSAWATFETALFTVTEEPIA